MITIVGLQNPGAEYENTRHNAGAIAVRAFGVANNFPSFTSSSKFAGEISEGVVAGKDVRLLLPTTFMNASGGSVRKAVELGSSIDELIIIYDELALALGTFKLSHGRGSGGHNGAESIINSLGTKEFTRVRIGISPVSLFGVMKKPTGASTADFVLKKFSSREQAKLASILPDISKAIETFIIEGKDKAMSAHN